MNRPKASTGDIAICPFTVVVDNREGHPYAFANVGQVNGRRLVVPLDNRYLPTGDYSIQGYEDRFALERKSLEDLYSTLGQNRERFKHELERLDLMDFAAIVVEATLAEVLDPALHRGNWQSRLNPRSAEQTMVAWSVRFPRVHWWLAGSRTGGERRIFDACRHYWQLQERKEFRHG